MTTGYIYIAIYSPYSTSCTYYCASKWNELQQENHLDLSPHPSPISHLCEGPATYVDLELKVGKLASQRSSVPSCFRLIFKFKPELEFEIIELDMTTSLNLDINPT
jgi:hypothetical protein